MVVTIELKQPRKKPKVAWTEFNDPAEKDLPGLLRKLWEAEQALNALPGSDLRVSISVEGGSAVKKLEAK